MTNEIPEEIPKGGKTYRDKLTKNDVFVCSGDKSFVLFCERKGNLWAHPQIYKIIDFWEKVEELPSREEPKLQEEDKVRVALKELKEELRTKYSNPEHQEDLYDKAFNLVLALEDSIIPQKPVSGIMEDTKEKPESIWKSVDEFAGIRRDAWVFVNICNMYSLPAKWNGRDFIDLENDKTIRKDGIIGWLYPSDLIKDHESLEERIKKLEGKQ